MWSEDSLLEVLLNSLFTKWMYNMDNKEYIKTVEYREEMLEKLAEDFWFMNIKKPCTWDPNFSWGDNCVNIEFGNGWLYELYELCGQLLVEVKSDFQVIQIKEKFGYANFYYSGTITPYGEQLIKNFEEDTKFICEICGEIGEIRGSNWYMCLCDECWEESQK